MSKDQMKTARVATDVRKAQREWRKTVDWSESVAAGSVRTATEKYAATHAALREFAGADRTDGRVAEAETALAHAEALVKDARGTLKSAKTYRDAVAKMIQDDAVWLVRECGASQRAAAKIVGVSEKSIRDWLNPERKAAERKEQSAKRSQERAAKRAVTPPTAKEVKAHLSASAALLAGLETASVADVRALEARVSAIQGALADLQGRSAKANRDAGKGVAAPGTAGSAA